MATNSTAKDEVTLVRGDETRTVKSVDDVVKMKFDGWTVEKAGAESVVAGKPKTETDKK